MFVMLLCFGEVIHLFIEEKMSLLIVAVKTVSFKWRMMCSTIILCINCKLISEQSFIPSNLHKNMSLCFFNRNNLCNISGRQPIYDTIHNQISACFIEMNSIRHDTETEGFREEIQ